MSAFKMVFLYKLSLLTIIFISIIMVSIVPFTFCHLQKLQMVPNMHNIEPAIDSCCKQSHRYLSDNFTETFQ